MPRICPHRPASKTSQNALATASGEKKKAERLGLANQHALFNPGPVT